MVRRVMGAALVGVVALGLGDVALAAPPARRGAVVVAVGDDASAAARPLARAVYADAALRPTIDDATARVLAGGAVAPGAPARLVELGDLRASLATSGDGAAARKLLAAIGADAGAEIVVSVAMRDGRATAQVIHVPGGAREGVELVATSGNDADGAPTHAWPNATTALRMFFAAPAPLAPAPLAVPKAATEGPKAPPAQTSLLRSPWFWGPLAGVAAVSIGVLVASKATSGDATDVHVTGKVAP